MSQAPEMRTPARAMMAYALRKMRQVVYENCEASAAADLP